MLESSFPRGLDSGRAAACRARTRLEFPACRTAGERREEYLYDRTGFQLSILVHYENYCGYS